MYSVAKEYKGKIVWCDERIELDKATQKQLAKLYKLGHPAVVKKQKK